MKRTTSEESDSDWSIEIYEGVHIPNQVSDLPKENKQRKLAQATTSQDSKPLHPFVKTYSTQVSVPVLSDVPPDLRKKTIQQVRKGNTMDLVGRADTVTQSSQYPDLESTIDGKEDKERPKPPPSRVFKLATSVKPNVDHDSVPLRESNSCNKPSDVELVINSCGGNASKEKPPSKEKSSTFPTYSYLEYGSTSAAVVYTQCEEEANDLVQTLKGPLGFDLEWRVMWQAGAAERRVALVQLCDMRTILLIQVSSMKRFPKSVMQVIESPNIVKTGANIRNDGEKLYRDFGIHARGLIELGTLATKADEKFSTIYNREIVSLAKMVSQYLERTLVKNSVRTSNWEGRLNAKMIQYAANDCHCALMVYNKILEIAEKDGKTFALTSCSCDIDPSATKMDRPVLRAISLEKNAVSESSTLRPPSLRDHSAPKPVSRQYLRAYKMWHERKMALDEMCMELKTGGRAEPLKASTVISYVIGALQANASLPFDLQGLRELVQMDAGSWQRHREWICKLERRL